LLRRIRDEGDTLHAQATALRVAMRGNWLAHDPAARIGEILRPGRLLILRGAVGSVAFLGKDKATWTDPHSTDNRRDALGADPNQDVQAGLNDYLGRFRRDGSCNRFLFVCSQRLQTLSLPSEPHLNLWTRRPSTRTLRRGGSIEWLTKPDAFLMESC